MIAIAWEYLTGTAVAATVTDREEPEWPPHPDRVFQALVASWGERGRAPDERTALAFLETLGPPELVAGSPEDVTLSASPKTYVPVNDGLTKKALDRDRKERFFPRVWVGTALCALRWPDAEAGPHREALLRLLSGVTRIGHSTSLVRAWLADETPIPTWRPARRGDATDVHLRVVEPGRLAALERDFRGGGEGWRRPRTADWAPYARVSPVDAVSGHHTGPLLVLRRVAGNPLGLAQAPVMALALRTQLMRHAPDDRVRTLLSGHAPDGSPLTVPHAAFIPLPFVGATHADGHLLGAAVVLPAEVTPDEEDGVYRALAAATDAETGALTLPLGERRSVTFALEERAAPPLALRAGSWARAARGWATVTPLVLDRQPPRTVADKDAFARAEIVRACAHAGLPAPDEIRLLDAPAWTGAPHARAFPPLPTKTGIRRRHLHAWLRFGVAVRGPVLLGAGRYRGYGLCRPFHDEIQG
jgi:CRISPR-associated protein Csb2